MSEKVIAYLNGAFMPLHEARISPMDRGFLFADSVYEVIPVYDGKFFHLSDHLKRLDESLHAVRINNPLANSVDAQKWLQTLVEKNGSGNQSLYLQISRGTEMHRDHRMPASITPTVFAFCAPLSPPTTEQSRRGIRAITTDDQRWLNCQIKSNALLGNVLAYQKGIDVGVDEVLLVRDGHLLEGASSNVFVVRDNVVMTPPTSNLILGGVTRDIILKLSAAHNIPHQLSNLNAADIPSYDEIWICSSTREIRPIIEVDGKVIGNGQCGPICEQLQTLYQNHKENYIHGG